MSVVDRSLVDPEQLATYGKSLLSLLGLAVVWNALTASGIVTGLPSPVAAAEAIVTLLGGSRFWTAVQASLVNIYVPYVIAALLGVPLGLATGWNGRVRDLFVPTLELLRPVPPIAWIPVMILLMPTSQLSIMFITFVGAFFPIFLNTMDGVREIDTEYANAVRSLGGSRLQVFRHVVYPAALPSIHTGLVVGMGLAWVNLVAAEMVASQGLGRMIWAAYTFGSYEQIVAGVVFVGVLGYVSSTVVRMLGDWRIHWKQDSV